CSSRIHRDLNCERVFFYASPRCHEYDAILSQVSEPRRPVELRGCVGKACGSQVIEQFQTKIAIAEDPIGIHWIAMILWREQVLDRSVFIDASPQRILIITVEGDGTEKPAARFEDARAFPNRGLVVRDLFQTLELNTIVPP
ncbi:MAG TPA: hypothetical protein VJY33_21905, partial [Isosphaeraceae bacterium]|nr:hypothetical protein [Isosphaeraceae bacterium]